MLSRAEALALIVSLIAVNDSDRLRTLETSDGEAILPSDHELAEEIKRLLSGIVNDHDFSNSPRFVAATRGKSEAFVAMKARFEADPVKRSKHREKLLAALSSLTTSRHAYSLVPLNRHADLDRILALVARLSNVS